MFLLCVLFHDIIDTCFSFSYPLVIMADSSLEYPIVESGVLVWRNSAPKVEFQIELDDIANTTVLQLRTKVFERCQNFNLNIEGGTYYELKDVEQVQLMYVDQKQKMDNGQRLGDHGILGSETDVSDSGRNDIRKVRFRLRHSKERLDAIKAEQYHACSSVEEDVLVHWSIRDDSGQKFTVGIKQSTEIGEVKQMITDWIKAKLGGDIPPARQRLVFEGNLLTDGRTCSDYNIQKGSELHLILHKDSSDDFFY